MFEEIAMSNDEEVKRNLERVFGLGIDYEKTGEILGKASLRSMIAETRHYKNDYCNDSRGSKNLDSIVKDWKNNWNKETKALVKKGLEYFSLAREKEIQSFNEMEKFLRCQLKRTEQERFTLPRLRAQKHFSVGDDVMYLTKHRFYDNVVTLFEYDWVPAKVIKVNNYWSILCLSLYPCYEPDPCGGREYDGYYLHSEQYRNGGLNLPIHQCHMANHMVYKRKDFFTIKEIIDNSSGQQLLKFIPELFIEYIKKGTIDPMTDTDLENSKADFIKLAIKAINWNDSDYDPVAKLYGIEISK